MKKNNKYFLLKKDSVFKNVFYRDEELLKRFLNDILCNFYDNFHIDKVIVHNTELTKDRLYIKNKTVDIFVEASGKFFNIEVNIDSSKRIINQNFFFLTSKLIEYIKKENKYINIPEHVQINFNWNGKTKDGFEELQYGNLKTKEVAIPFIKTININVDYFINEWYTNGKKKSFYDKYKSIIVFGLNEKQFKCLKDDDIYMKKLVSDVESLNKDPAFYQWMTDEEDIECQLNSAFVEGEDQGSKQTEENIIRAMKEKGMSDEDIQEIINLSTEV